MWELLPDIPKSGTANNTQLTEVVTSSHKGWRSSQVMKVKSSDFQVIQSRGVATGGSVYR